MPAPAYAARIERWWIDAARRITGEPDGDRAIDRLEPQAETLSNQFTTTRPGAMPPYGDDPALRAAYGLYFFPRSYARIRAILAECRAMSALPAPGRTALRMLDLGAGTGPASAAAADEFDGTGIDITAVDRSPDSLADAARMFRDVFDGRSPPARFTGIPGGLAAPAAHGSFDLIVASFVLNETADDPATCVNEWIAALRDGGLLILCEPAQEPSARRMEELRDRVAADARLRIVAPCPHAAPCPLRREGIVWCHEVRRWTPPASMLRLNRRLQRDVHVLKFSFLVLQRTPPTPVAATPLRARLVASVQQEAGKLVTRGCAADGHVHTYEVLTRTMDRATRDRIVDVERGTRIRWPDAKPVGGNRLRASGPPEADPT